MGLTYKQIIEMAIENVAEAMCVYNGNEDMINKPFIQYQETAWEFLKRVASEKGNYVYEVAEYKRPYVMINARNNVIDLGNAVIEKRSGIDGSFFELGGIMAGYRRMDFLYFFVTCNKNISIGQSVMYKGSRMIIYEKYMYFEKGEICFCYMIGAKGLEKAKIQKNRKIVGASLRGTVLDVNTKVKIHLDIDKEQDKDTAYEYEWSPLSGNLMYCMPEVGTRVSLYFLSAD